VFINFVFLRLYQHDRAVCVTRHLIAATKSQRPCARTSRRTHNAVAIAALFQHRYWQRSCDEVGSITPLRLCRFGHWFRWWWRI